MERNTFPILLFAAAVLMLAGTALMLVRRRHAGMLLLSSLITGAGYGLLPLGLSGKMEAGFVYYMLAYVCAHAGLLTVVSLVKQSGNYSLDGYAGLYYRAPWLSAAMGVFLLSLAGLPLTGGFFAKLFILWQAVSAEANWAAAIMAACTAVSYYGYFMFIRFMYIKAGQDDSGLKISRISSVILAVCVVCLLLLGFFPGAAVDYVERYTG